MCGNTIFYDTINFPDVQHPAVRFYCTAPTGAEIWWCNTTQGFALQKLGQCPMTCVYYTRDFLGDNSFFTNLSFSRNRIGEDFHAGRRYDNRI